MEEREKGDHRGLFSSLCNTEVKYFYKSILKYFPVMSCPVGLKTGATGQ